MTANRRTARPLTSATLAPPLASVAAASPGGARWLLLIHQIPPKPDYLRVKIGRRLQRVGAVAIKNSVYVLPPSPESYEDFRWIVAEIEDAGGEAFVSEASLGAGLSDNDVRARFDAARNGEYHEIVTDSKALLKTAKRAAHSSAGDGRTKSDTTRATAERELARLRRHYETVRKLDFFDASEGKVAADLFGEIEVALRRRAAKARPHHTDRHIHSAIWVTRRDVHIDRIASAWLIRRFVDRRPTFRFVDATRYTHRPGELRFDMFEAEYTHRGDACTFEVLVGDFAVADHALSAIGEIVHDIDCKDEKFGRDEAPGVARLIDGIVALHAGDDDRLECGERLFDNLYAAFGGSTITR